MAVPYVDLRKEPYFVTPDEEGAAAANTAAMNTAIASASGTGARLVPVRLAEWQLVRAVLQRGRDREHRVGAGLVIGYDHGIA